MSEGVNAKGAKDFGLCIAQGARHGDQIAVQNLASRLVGIVRQGRHEGSVQAVNSDQEFGAALR